MLREMNENIVFERSKASDAAEMLVYLGKIGAETDNLTFGAEGLPITLPDEEEYLKNLETSEDSVIFLAKIGDKIIGDASFDRNPRERLRHRGELGISVLREYWGQGIATKLISMIIDFAKNTAKAEIISLEVRCDNERAVRLYERFGFQRIGTFKGFLKIRGELVDFYIMNLYL